MMKVIPLCSLKNTSSNGMFEGGGCSLKVIGQQQNSFNYKFLKKGTFIFDQILFR